MHLHLRLQGGGGDGGSTGAESRSCFLEMYSSRKAAKVPSACIVNCLAADSVSGFNKKQLRCLMSTSRHTVWGIACIICSSQFVPADSSRDAKIIGLAVSPCILMCCTCGLTSAAA